MGDEPGKALTLSSWSIIDTDNIFNSSNPFAEEEKTMSSLNGEELFFCRKDLARRSRNPKITSRREAEGKRMQRIFMKNEFPDVLCPSASLRENLAEKTRNCPIVVQRNKGTKKNTDIIEWKRSRAWFEGNRPGTFVS